MKCILIIALTILSIGCTKNAAGDESCIKVMLIQQHPFLIDHDRILVTLNFDGDTIDRINLYPDTGIGCETHVFSHDNQLIAIDCNGFWYSIDKYDMKIRNEGWKWEYKLPKNYIGTMTFNKITNDYTLVKKASGIGSQDVYKHKNPEKM